MYVQQRKNNPIVLIFCDLGDDFLKVRRMIFSNSSISYTADWPKS